MQSWDLRSIVTPGGSRSPVVLYSHAEWRVVLIALDPGQELGDHEVKEYVLLVVVEGTVRIDSGGESRDAGAGTLVFFEREERRTVAAPEGARLLLMLAPWPGVGHYRES